VNVKLSSLTLLYAYFANTHDNTRYYAVVDEGTSIGSIINIGINASDCDEAGTPNSQMVFR
jgi:patatin-like phospholipase/acyl hydrolase